MVLVVVNIFRILMHSVFPFSKGHSREVYHTKRMQRLTSVLWTKDNKYVISGSDEMNIRIWKAKAWEKLGIVSATVLISIELSELPNYLSIIWRIYKLTFF